MQLDVTRHIEEIRADRVHGAGWLARQAVLLLGQALSTSAAADLADLEKNLREVIAGLIAAKPTMAPVANLVCRLGCEVLDQIVSGRVLASVKHFADRRARELAIEADEAVRLASECALAIISPGASILTCSYSSAIRDALVQAERSGRHPSLLIARSWDGAESHGERLAHQLSARGLAAEIVPDSSLEASAGRATLALIGADAVLPDASVVNGYPSRALAEAASRARVPLYCVCETIKLDARPLLGRQTVVEPGFESVPSSLLTGFCTEQGLLQLREVVQLVPRMARYLTPFLQSV